MTAVLEREAPTEGRLDLKIKATPVLDSSGADQGIVEAYISVFGIRDSYGHVVIPGAFADDVAAFNAGDKRLPVVWSHQRADLDAYVGDVIGLVEDEIGLLVRMQFDLEQENEAKAYRLVKSGRINQWSFGYLVVEGAWVETDTDFYYELRKLELYEVGPTLVGANPETRTVSVKSAGVKAGRTISAATRKALESAQTALATASDEITALLALTDEGGKQSDPHAKSAVDNRPAAEASTDAGKAPEPVVLTADEATRVAKALGHTIERNS